MAYKKKYSKTISKKQNKKKLGPLKKGGDFIDFYRSKNGKIDRDLRGRRKPSSDFKKFNSNKSERSAYGRGGKTSSSNYGFSTRSFKSNGWSVNSMNDSVVSSEGFLNRYHELQNHLTANEHDKKMELIKQGYVELPNGMLYDFESERQRKRSMHNF